MQKFKILSTCPLGEKGATVSLNENSGQTRARIKGGQIAPVTKPANKPAESKVVKPAEQKASVAATKAGKKASK